MTSTLSRAGAPADTPDGGLSGAIGRRRPTGVGVLATAAGPGVVAPLPDRVQTSVSAWCVLLAAVVHLTWGTARGDLADRRLLTAQTAAVLGSSAVALATVLLTVGSV